MVSFIQNRQIHGAQGDGYGTEDAYEVMKMLYNLWGEEGVCIFVNIPKAAELHA